jgi:hypothetical protein
VEILFDLILDDLTSFIFEILFDLIVPLAEALFHLLAGFGRFRRWLDLRPNFDSSAAFAAAQVRPVVGRLWP